MGLNMNNIHTPSVPSGPTTGHDATSVEQGKLSLMDLISEKERVESELSALSSVLDSHGVNMTTSLTTFDGYPRDDLDTAQIRTTRARVIRLRNDYKALMLKIEDGLHAHHASIKASDSSASGSSQGASANENSNAENQNVVEPPFARLSSIVPGSPAENAGLKVGDKIKKFGNINWMNHEKLSKVTETVQKNEGQIIIVKVLRQGSSSSQPEELQIQLTPRRNWGGRGLLGCHLLPQ